MAGHEHVRRCLYEVLGVERTATEDEIKKAYRKAALRWHPDKNAENMEEATERFKEITEAHSTLSDSNERAWYDSHREQILRGGTGLDDDDDGVGIDLFKYFSSSCFRGYGDDKGGFYAVFDAVFKEIDALETGDVKKSAEEQTSPSLGTSTTAWLAGPAKFYQHWENFSTNREFGWCDKYNPNDAPNRH